MMERQKAPDLRLLAAFSAMVPLSMDLYLAAWPNIAASLRSSMADIELSLSLFLVGYGVSQLVYGPISDSFGRRPVILWGTLLFTASSFLIVVSESFEVLLVLRFIQGAGACAGQIMSRAIVRDCYERDEASKALSLLMLVTMMVPLLGPSLGGVFISNINWRMIFMVLGVAGIVMSWFVSAKLNETLSDQFKRPFDLVSVLRGYKHLSESRIFVGYGASSAFIVAGVFVYLSAIPHVLMEIFSVPAERFGLYFSSNIILQMVMALANSFLVLRYGADAILKVGLTIAFLSAVVMVFEALFGMGWYAELGVPLALFMSSLPLIGGNSLACALNDVPELAGTGAALIGATQLGIGAILGVILAQFHDGSTVPFAMTIFLCAGMSITSYIILVRK